MHVNGMPLMRRLIYNVRLCVTSEYRRRRAFLPHLSRTCRFLGLEMSNMSEMPLVQVKAKDLPVHCPNPAMSAWSMHPRVFIDVSHGEARCPYCGTRYVLAAGEVVRGH